METYRVTVEEEPSGCGTVVGFIVFMIVMSIILNFCGGHGTNNNPSAGNTNNAGNGQSQESRGDPEVETTLPDRMNFADLHVLTDYSDVVDTVHNGSIEDSYGNKYYGPYLQLTSANSVISDWEWSDGFTVLVTDGRYNYMSGTFFAESRYDDASVIFRIYADDELIYESEPVFNSSKAINFSVSIKGAETVKVSAVGVDYGKTGGNIQLYLVDAEVSK